jgi:hypothetical protein
VSVSPPHNIALGKVGDMGKEGRRNMASVGRAVGVPRVVCVAIQRRIFEHLQEMSMPANANNDIAILHSRHASSVHKLYCRRLDNCMCPSYLRDWVFCFTCGGCDWCK